MKKVKEFLENCEAPCIVFDYDVDGICASAIIKIIIEALNKRTKGIVASSRPPVAGGKLSSIIKNQDPKEIIILDIEASQYKDFVLDLKEEDRKILVLDHHPPEQKLEDGILHINSHFLNKGYYPTAKMAYDVAQEFDIGGIDWIAAVGIISDAGGKENKEFVEKTIEEYGFDRGEDEYYFDSGLGEISKILNSFRIAKPTSETPNLVRRLSRMRTPQRIQNDWQLLKIHKKVDGYIENKKKLAKENLEDNRIFIKLEDPKYAVRSTLASVLSHMYPEKNIAIAQISSGSDQVHLSLRSHRINLRETIKEAGDLCLRGGGHKNSVGVVVDKEKFEGFWKYLKEKLK